MLQIDGSRGEGGGQILRTSLTLSMITGRPLQIQQIRAQRAKPGLMRQHLTAVKAAAKVCGAETEGAELGSRTLTFRPGAVQAGQYSFDIGTAGSASLVLQTILPPLMIAGGASQLTLRGGTHNMHAPPFDFLAKAFLPLLARIGPRVQATLVRHGFYPAGGGEVAFAIQPASKLSPIELVDAGPVLRRHATAVVSRLPVHIAERELETIRRKLSLARHETSAHVVGSAGPGNAVMIEIERPEVTELFTGFGRRGVPAEEVAAGVAGEAARYLATGAAVGEHLADQLLLPLALAGGGRYRAVGPTPHATTNVETIRRFLEVAVEVEKVESDVCEIRLGAACG